MLAEPSTIGLALVFLVILLTVAAGGIAIVVLLIRFMGKSQPSFATSAGQVMGGQSNQTSPGRRNGMKSLWLWLPLTFVLLVGVIFAMSASKPDVLGPVEFFQILDSHRIIQAKVDHDSNSPLFIVTGTYQKLDGEGLQGHVVAAHFRTKKMLLSDEMLVRVLTSPNVVMVEPNNTLFSLLMTVLPLLLLFLILLGMGFIAFVVYRLLEKKRAVPTLSGSPPPTQPTPRKCPQCGAQLKPDAPEGLCPACLLLRGIATEGGAPPQSTPFTQPPISEVMKLFPQLEILEVVGQGGMGAVYKARQPALERFVALKILTPRSGGDLDFAGRFSREARALARLSHPNIVAVYDFGQISGRSDPSTPDPRPLSYFIMEYVDGSNLRQVEQAGKLTPREALQIIPQICSALQFAHDEGIVHRDIKPENVLLDKKGRVKIADFGLAKILGQQTDLRLTGARDVMGTPHYMAPEQVEKPQEVDHRADIYSLGVVFYEMLTGELPLGKFDPPSHKVQVDVRVDEVVLRSLAKSPERRYQQVSEVKTELETIATTPPGPAPQPQPNSFFYPLGWEYKSNKTVFGMPLLHVTGGINPATRKANVSRGFFAFGQIAKGVFAFGGRAYGVFAFGGLAAGVFAFGGLAAGLVAFGGLALGLLLAVGGGSLGSIALGGQALGFVTAGGQSIGVRPVDPKWLIISLALGVAIVLCSSVAVIVVTTWARRRATFQTGSTPPPAGTGNVGAPPATLSAAASVAATIANILLALLLVFLGWGANRFGIFFNAVFLAILLMVPIRCVVILWRAFRGTLEYGLWRNPFAPELAPHRWQVLNRWVFWGLSVAVLQACIVPAQINQAYALIRAIEFGGAAALILLELLPARRLRLATNMAVAIGSVFMATQLARIYAPQSKAGAVVLQMPVRGEWLILNGGPSSLINIHYDFAEQSDAIDMEKLVGGGERVGVPTKLESYPSWGETVYAPADGKIAVVENDLDDNVVGEMDRQHPVGNHICIDMGGNRFVMLAHLQKASVLVSPGDTVHAGQPLARCGNSGNTSHPHLHIQVQNMPRIFVTGRRDAKTYPILFEGAKRMRGDTVVSDVPFFVRRNDKLVFGEETNVAQSDSSDESVQAIVHVRRFTSYSADNATVDYAATVPDGYELRATANGGNVHTLAKPGTAELEIFWMRSRTIHPPQFLSPGQQTVPTNWPPPIKFDSNEQREAQRASLGAQLQALQDQGPIPITFGQPKQLFSITNGSGEVWKGSIELVRSNATDSAANAATPALEQVQPVVAFSNGAFIPPEEQTVLIEQQRNNSKVAAPLPLPPSVVPPPSPGRTVRPPPQRIAPQTGLNTQTNGE